MDKNPEAAHAACEIDVPPGCRGSCYQGRLQCTSVKECYQSVKMPIWYSLVIAAAVAVCVLILAVIIHGFL